MKQSNYDITSVKMRESFLTYDQSVMIRKFGLDSDERYIYLAYLARKFRVDRNTGETDALIDGSWKSAGPNEVMTVYDVLCWSRNDCAAAGRYTARSNLEGVSLAAAPDHDTFTKQAALFTGKCNELRAACEALGGIAWDNKGDVCFKLPLFPFLHVILRFYDEDDEFPASLQLLWDEHVLHFVHYETSYYIEGALMIRLRDLVNGMG